MFTDCTGPFAGKPRSNSGFVFNSKSLITHKSRGSRACSRRHQACKHCLWLTHRNLHVCRRSAPPAVSSNAKRRDASSNDLRVWYGH